jgi:hypothetical protein
MPQAADLPLTEIYRRHHKLGGRPRKQCAFKMIFWAVTFSIRRSGLKLAGIPGIVVPLTQPCIRHLG